jgi:hypothetical protein
MWGQSSLSNRYQSNTNKVQYPLPNPNSLPDYNILYQTPIKQLEYQNNNNNNFTSTPFRFDFNHYFGNLWSSGKMPNNQILQPQLFLSPTQLNKDNIPLNKKSIEESYKLTPISQLKYSNSSNNSSSNSNNNNMNNINKATSGNNNINFPQNNNANNNNVINNNNKNNYNNCNYFNGYNNGNINNNINKNTNDIAKKNLNELFNNAKNDNSLYDKEKMKFINNINNFNNCNIINNINHYTNNNTNNNYINERKRFNRNCNLQISRQFIFSSPLCSTKPKKIFECSGSTLASMSSNKNTINNNRNRRFRKNNEQISLLKKFYDEHKHWSKNQIKEISQKIGLKENKVYKWLWDQRNKELKATKFVVKKDGNKNLVNKEENDDDEKDE